MVVIVAVEVLCRRIIAVAFALRAGGALHVVELVLPGSGIAGGIGVEDRRERLLVEEVEELRFSSISRSDRCCQINVAPTASARDLSRLSREPAKH